jgi:hypothetical protein
MRNRQDTLRWSAAYGTFSKGSSHNPSMTLNLGELESLVVASVTGPDKDGGAVGLVTTRKIQVAVRVLDVAESKLFMQLVGAHIKPSGAALPDDAATVDAIDGSSLEVPLRSSIPHIILAELDLVLESYQD